MGRLNQQAADFGGPECCQDRLLHWSRGVRYTGRLGGWGVKSVTHLMFSITSAVLVIFSGSELYSEHMS